VPGISRVLVLTYLADPIAPLQVKAMTEAAASLGVMLQVHDIRSADDLPAAFDAAVSEGAEGLIVTGETIFVTHRARVSELAARHRLPAMYPFLIQVGDGGGLMGYVTVPTELQRISGSVKRPSSCVIWRDGYDGDCAAWPGCNGAPAGDATPRCANTGSARRSPPPPRRQRAGTVPGGSVGTPPSKPLCPTPSSPSAVFPPWRRPPHDAATEPPCTDPYARWWGRGGAARLPPIPIALERAKQRRGYAEQVRARRLKIVCCESQTSSACKNIFPGQPYRARGRVRVGVQPAAEASAALSVKLSAVDGGGDCRPDGSNRARFLQGW